MYLVVIYKNTTDFNEKFQQYAKSIEKAREIVKNYLLRPDKVEVYKKKARGRAVFYHDIPLAEYDGKIEKVHIEGLTD